MQWFNQNDEHEANISLKENGYWEGTNIQLSPDGSKKAVESIVNVIKDESGKKVGLLTITRDITKRVNVDEWLFESNQRLNYALKLHVSWFTKLTILPIELLSLGA